MVQRNTDKEILTIEKDEYPSEEQDNTETKETTADDNYEAVLQTTDAGGFKNVATAAIKSLVLIDVYKTDMGNILTETQSATETVGLVIGQVNSEYIILTNAAVVRDSSSLVVKVSKATEVDAELVGSDTDTGIAIVSVKESQIPSKERSSIVTAQLDNSYSIQQGILSLRQAGFTDRIRRLITAWFQAFQQKAVSITAMRLSARDLRA